MEPEPTVENLLELETKIAALLDPTRLTADTVTQLQHLIAQRDTMRARLEGDGNVVQGSKNLVATESSLNIGGSARNVVSAPTTGNESPSSASAANVKIIINSPIQPEMSPYMGLKNLSNDDSKPTKILWRCRDNKLLSNYFERARKFDEFFSSLSQLDEIKILNFMVSSGLAVEEEVSGKTFLTQAGILLCCQRDYIPIYEYHVHVKFQTVSDGETYREELWGSVLYLYNELRERLLPFSARRFGSASIRDEFGSEMLFFEYPEIAITEALVNFLIHRDYSLDDMGFITIHPDKIEFMNPGQSVIDPVTLLNSTEPLRPLYRRNPRLIESMSRVRLNQREGSGILRIKNELHKNDSYLPNGSLGLEIQNLVENNRFLLTIFKNNYKPLKALQ